MMGQQQLRYASLAIFGLLAAQPLVAQTRPTIDDFMSAPNPLELTSAKKADRVAWVTWERGLRNVYTAAAPAFKPTRITSFLKDDGQELGDVHLSDDGSIAVFVRGGDPNDEGWIPNPTHDPAGSEQAIWAARTAGGAAWRLVQGSAPELSPDGHVVVYIKDDQIYRVRVPRGVPQDSMDRGLKPFIQAWGAQSNPVWSPDGARIAFVSDRSTHSFIGIYDVRTRKVDFVAPSIDCDANPTWSPDGKRVAFVRRPGTPFGAQLQTLRRASTTPPNRYCENLRDNPFRQDTTHASAPAGFYASTFADGSTVKLMIADVARVNADIASDAATEVWHNQAKDAFTGIGRMMWARDHLVFPLSPPSDEWDRYYSISIAQPTAPVMLTTTNGLIENESSASLSADASTLYYTTNANDIERRHIWAVPVSGGTPVQLSSGVGIETSPKPLPSGRQLALFYFGAKQPASVALMPVKGGASKIFYPTLPARFPMAAHVVPEIILTRAPDSLEIHNQLFLPADLKAGDKRPAIIFVHGGPMRQMMPGYHYMHFYHWAYAVNQWLASQGYIVMSVNYRLGIGYGRSFREAKNGGRNGDSEYQDVLAGAKYLQSRADVDPARVGIWGLSYGGLLTAEALARNSDVFKAGVDMAGVHLWGNTLDTAAVSYQASPVSQVDKWTSPVLLIQGDDDRNVGFGQTVGLVPLLRARKVPFELIIIPDDTHESLLYSRWVYLWNRMGTFLKENLWEPRHP